MDRVKYLGKKRVTDTTLENVNCDLSFIYYSLSYDNLNTELFNEQNIQKRWGKVYGG